MHLKFFADSYEYVKKAVIHAIAEPKEWLVHLMLFRSIGGGPRGGGLIIAEYAAFLGLPEAAVLPRNDREKQHLVSDLGKRPSQHAFLDPDTGIKQRERNGGYIRPDRVQQVARQCPGRITLAFDHAFRDGGDARQKVEEKRNLVCAPKDLHGGAVIAKEHRTVCLIWLSTEEGKALAVEVAERLRDRLHIPDRRIIAPR